MSRINKLWPLSLLMLAALVLSSGRLVADSSGWYVDGKFGQSTLRDSFGSNSPKVFDDDSETASVEVGYNVNKYIGVQAGYHDLGTFQGTGTPCPERFEICVALLAPVEAEIGGWSLAAVPSWPFTERFSVFGKVGVLDWESDLSTRFALPGVGNLDGFSESDLVTGLGARYRFANNLGALAEYQRLDLDLGSATLGLSWKF